MEHARHVFRVLFVLLLAIVAVVLGRTLLVPKSYGMYGPYRFDNVAEQAAARPPLHGGAAACADCHDERSKKLSAGVHANVSCEICDRPLVHAVCAVPPEDPRPAREVPADRPRAARPPDGPGEARGEGLPRVPR